MAPHVRPRVFVTRQLPGEALGRLSEQVEPRVWEDELPPSCEALLEHAREVEGPMDNLLAALDGRRPPHCVNPELFT